MFILANSHFKNYKLNFLPVLKTMADVLDIDNAEEFEVDDDGDRELIFFNKFELKNENNLFQREFCG